MGRDTKKNKNYWVVRDHVRLVRRERVGVPRDDVQVRRRRQGGGGRQGGRGDRGAEGGRGRRQGGRLRDDRRPRARHVACPRGRGARGRVARPRGPAAGAGGRVRLRGG